MLMRSADLLLASPLRRRWGTGGEHFLLSAMLWLGGWCQVSLSSLRRWIDCVTLYDGWLKMWCAGVAFKQPQILPPILQAADLSVGRAARRSFRPLTPGWAIVDVTNLLVLAGEGGGGGKIGKFVKLKTNSAGWQHTKVKNNKTNKRAQASRFWGYYNI